MLRGQPESAASHGSQHHYSPAGIQGLPTAVLIVQGTRLEMTSACQQAATALQPHDSCQPFSSCLPVSHQSNWLQCMVHQAMTCPAAHLWALVSNDAIRHSTGDRIPSTGGTAWVVPIVGHAHATSRCSSIGVQEQGAVQCQPLGSCQTCCPLQICPTVILEATVASTSLHALMNLSAIQTHLGQDNH